MMVISRIKMMKTGGVFNFLPTMFKRKKSKHGGHPNKKKNNKKKKKKKKEKVSCSVTSLANPISSISSRSSNEDWLIFEILTRLPVKTLIRFKSVCKDWCSLIRKDQNFIDLHLTRSRKRPPRIFIVVPLPRTKAQVKLLNRLQGASYYDYWPYKEFHITADLLVKEEEEEPVDNNGVRTSRGTKLKLVVDTVRKINSSSYHEMLKPINGLICLIDNYIKHGVRIRNICTGQVSPWFHSSLGEGEKYPHGFPHYGFGFDPATNEHKLVCVWHMQSGINHYICEVLTIGHQGNSINNNNRWRRIEDVPPDGPWGDSVYVNGVIYWTNFSLFRWPKCKYSPACLVAFDVGSEKFRTITVPDFILDQSGDALDQGNCSDEVVKLFELHENLAMVVKLNNCTFKMYTYEDNDYKNKKDEINGITTSSSKNRRWSEVSSITLPFHTEKYHTIKFHTFVGSDDKIFVTLVVWGLGKKKKCVSIYCYNWKKGSWTEVDISEIPSSVPQLCYHSFSTTFYESLLSGDNRNTL